MFCLCATLTEAVFVYLGIWVFVFGSKVSGGDEWIVDVISFLKIFGLCGLKCHIVEIWRDVMFEDDDGQRKCEYRARICEAGFELHSRLGLTRQLKG